jgi:hypothetical protein
MGDSVPSAHVFMNALGSLVASSSFASSDESDGSVLVACVTACLDLKRQAPLLGSLQLVHATGQISYLLHPSTRDDAFQRHQERAEPTHDSETAGCRSGSNKKHQRGKGKQAGGQCQSNVARQDWKKEKEKGQRQNFAKIDSSLRYAWPLHDPAARRCRTFNSGMEAAGAAPGEGYQDYPITYSCHDCPAPCARDVAAAEKARS